MKLLRICPDCEKLLRSGHQQRCFSCAREDKARKRREYMRLRRAKVSA